MIPGKYKRAGWVFDHKEETGGLFEGEPQVSDSGGAHQTYPNASGHGYQLDRPGIAHEPGKTIPAPWLEDIYIGGRENEAL